MKRTVLLTALALLLTSTAHAQEDAQTYVSGIRLEETESRPREEETNLSQTIIVIGRRSPDSLPLAYEPYVRTSDASLTRDDSFGEGRYEFHRQLFEINEDASVELYSTWVEDPSEAYEGAPTNNGRSGRWVCRRPLLEVFYCLNFWD